MVNPSIVRHLLSDDKSVSDYLQGKVVSYQDIKRRIFLLERGLDTTIPDHYYHLMLERDTKRIKSIDELLCKGLSNLADSYLKLERHRLYVRKEEFNNWQRLITTIPPLILMSAKLHQERPIPNKDIPAIRNYFVTNLIPNSLYTALPYPDLEDLEEMVYEKGGLYDLHIHLNGSTETDLAWQDFLASPQKLYKDLKLGVLKVKVQEQFEQESHLLTPKKLYHLIKIARRIRQTFYDFIFPGRINELKNNSLEGLLNQIVFSENDDLSIQNFRHPFRNVLDRDLDLPNNLPVEGLMYVLIFNDLERSQSPALATLFHFYLLILGLFNRLLVQQLHQYGFEQFQKHTLNNLRDQSELNYSSRFLQIHGNELRNLGLLEGRFSPQKSELENRILLGNVLAGWNAFEKVIKKRANPPATMTPDLTLIAHFIKKKEKKDKDADRYIRHKELRMDLWKRALVLSFLLKKKEYKKLIVGIDAAANELDTPPEVFGPVFRKMRRDGVIRHFTYHAGEDFYHVLGGLRAIYETVVFNELDTNDRIGHATAAGIDPETWFNAIGETMLIRRGEWLDDLVFVHFFIIFLSITDLGHLLTKIESTILQLSFEVYGARVTIDLLKGAWLLRGLCPIHVFAANIREAQLTSVFDYKEWQDVQYSIKSARSVELLRQYHSRTMRANYNEILEIETNSLINPAEIRELQLKLLEFLSNKGIILETLPTSNVRISHYNDYADHHLWNWKAWKEKGLSVPKIVVGSDDTGIFATSIFNEYAHIYCELVNGKGKTPKEAMAFLEELNDNSVDFRF